MQTSPNHNLPSTSTPERRRHLSAIGREAVSSRRGLVTVVAAPNALRSLQAMYPEAFTPVTPAPEPMPAAEVRLSEPGAVEEPAVVPARPANTIHTPPFNPDQARQEVIETWGGWLTNGGRS